jgi:hypothetical protein
VPSEGFSGDSISERFPHALTHIFSTSHTTLGYNLSKLIVMPRIRPSQWFYISFMGRRQRHSPTMVMLTLHWHLTLDFFSLCRFRPHAMSALFNWISSEATPHFLFSHRQSVTSVAASLGMPDTRSQLHDVTQSIHYGRRSADFFGNIRRARHAFTIPLQKNERQQRAL